MQGLSGLSGSSSIFGSMDNVSTPRIISPAFWIKASHETYLDSDVADDFIPSSPANNDGDLVRTWGDLVNPANSFMADITKDNQRPTLKTDGPNGQRYLHFNETANILFMKHSWFQAGGGVLLTQPYTVFVIMRWWNPTDANRGAIDGKDANRFALFNSAGPVLKVFGTTSSSNIVNTTNVWHGFMIEMNSPNSKFSLDGAAEVAFSVDPGSNAWSSPIIGCLQDQSFPAPVDFAEIFAVPRLLTASEKNSMLAYLSSTYGLW
jgi:hypothetical protein